MRVGLYDDPIFLEHDAGPGHPERPQRLIALREGIRDAGLEARLEPIAPREATRDELLCVHTDAHVATVAATSGRRLGVRNALGLRISEGPDFVALNALGLHNTHFGIVEGCTELAGIL